MSLLYESIALPLSYIGVRGYIPLDTYSINLLPLVTTHKLSLVENMTGHRLLNVFLTGAFRQDQFSVESVNLKKISMLSIRRTRAVVGRIPARADAVNPGRVSILRNLADLRRNIKNNPVIPHARRRVRIVHNQRQSFSACGYATNNKRRADILSVA